MFGWKMTREIKMKCKACGHEYIYILRGVLKIPVAQECPKCKKWTGEPKE
jgi:predicted Zn-ribbon and HTH transcriptional regulator